MSLLRWLRLLFSPELLDERGWPPIPGPLPPPPPAPQPPWLGRSPYRDACCTGRADGWDHSPDCERSDVNDT
jgi:hypothetical protein